MTFTVQSNAETVSYTLENIILDDTTMITGSFSWTYDSGDFENGTALINTLNIPHTLHDHTDLEVNVDTQNSIEITYPGNFHDDGVDINLVLTQPLSPAGSASLDLIESKYDIGGNGFHAGVFISGMILPLVDLDGDSIADNEDNCTSIANPNQRDTNNDGYGNACDPDLNNDGIVNFIDFSMWVPFFATTASEDTDFNGDGFTNFGDFALFPEYFQAPPGPSGVAVTAAL